MYGENISSLVEFRLQGKNLPNPTSCDHASIQQLKHLEWMQNTSIDAVRVPQDPRGLWLRFTLENPSEKSEFFSVLIQWINLPFVELCSENSEGKVIDVYSGYKWENWYEILSPFPHFNVELSPGEGRTFYLRVFSNQDLNYPIRLLSEGMYRGVVMFRFLSFVLFSALAVIYLLWGVREFRKTGYAVFLGISLHYLAFFSLVYLVHGRELASVYGNQNNLIKHSYYLLLALNHFAFFLYLANFDSYSGGTERKSIKFWLFAISGSLYVLVPLVSRFYEYRIFLVLTLFSGLITYLLKTHLYLIQKDKTEEKFYVIGWIVFQALVFLKTLYHFDFYPYQEFAIYASVFYLPLLSAGSFLVLHGLEKRKSVIVKQKNIYQILDVPYHLNKLQSLIQIEKIHLDPSSSEETVAQLMGITYHQLSEIINSEYKMNFPTLMNKHRIEDSKKLLIEQSDLNVAEIGKMAGFGSRSAFYLEFKKQTGINPNQFKKKAQEIISIESGSENQNK
ncbi:MAG: helix-turn-helix domain-containing protein [Leptospira sp.]|nr:helix-turn-helix domain-containing protein [Leptospira sp.]